jgi:hypothetical protein
VFLGVCLTLWTLGGIAVIANLVSDHNDRLFSILWLCNWVACEIGGISTGLWNSFGQERMLINKDFFTHTRVLFGRTLTSKSLRSSKILKVRTEGPFGSAFRSRQLNFAGGTVALDYRWDSFLCGYELEEEEATAIVEALLTFIKQQPLPLIETPVEALN